MSQQVLLPCPFCGSTDLQRTSRTSGHGESCDVIACNQCEGRMEAHRGDPAIAWNMRAVSTGKHELVENITQAVITNLIPMLADACKAVGGDDFDSMEGALNQELVHFVNNGVQQWTKP